MKNSIIILIVAGALFSFGRIDEPTTEPGNAELAIRPYTYEVNSFYTFSQGGKQYWSWKDAPGHICGTSRTAIYRVQQGDSYVPTGKCSSGTERYKISYSGRPTYE